MKYVIIILGLIIAMSYTRKGHVIASGHGVIRDTVPTGVPQLFGSKLYEFRNYVVVDSFLMIQAGDTFAIPRWPAIKFKTSDLRWYGYHGTRWRAFLNGLDTVSLSNRINSAGIPLNNVGSGYRRVKAADGQIKTEFAGYGIIKDSTTNTDAITDRVDTSSTNHVVTQSDLIDAISGNWHITGNSGTDSTVNFIGTIDIKPLVFKTKNIKAVIIDTNQRVGIGVNSPGKLLDVGGDVLINGILYGRGGGNEITNIAAGANSLGSNTSGSVNVAYGSQSLSSNVTGFGNTGVGYQALNANAAGNVNTAVGFQTGFSLTGSGCSLFGAQVGSGWLTTQSNIAAIHNTADGAWLWGNMVTGQVQINAATVPVLTSSAALEIRSTTRGLLTPIMTATQRVAISSPATGLEVFDTDSLRKMMHNGSAWKAVAWTTDAKVTSINSETGPGITIQGGTATSVSTTTNTVSVNVTPSSNAIPHTLDAQFTTQGNSGTGETDLYSYSVPADKLAIDGRTVNFEIDGEFNDATATAQLKLYFAGNVTLNTGAIIISTAFTAWKLRGYVIRTSTTTAHVTYELQCPGLATPLFIGYTNLTSLDFTIGNIFKVTAQAGGAGGGTSDITAHSWQVLYKPQPQ